MVLLCGALTVLQYRWTGELARAEVARLRKNLNEQAQLLTRDFDDELAHASAQLTPTGGEIEDHGRDAAFAERLAKWNATNPRPIFSRMAVFAPTDAAPGLFALDPKTGKLSAMNWPATWDELRDHIARRGGPPERPAPIRPQPPGAEREAPPGMPVDRPGAPLERREKPAPPPPPRGGGSNPGNYLDRNGTLLLLPIQGSRSRENGGESAALILELDAHYLTNEWLPQLVRQYLDPQGAGADDVVVSAPGANRPPILSLRPGNVPGAADVSLEFNHAGRSAGTPRGLSTRSAWLLEVWHRPGDFEALVAVSRRRNLAVAAGLNLLIIAAGALLVRHTRRSRKLVEAQMNFVANVSHELRTPLTVIRGAAHNLERGVVQDPAQIGRYLRLIIDQGNQLSSMIEQVLAYAGANRSAALLHRQPLALKDLLGEAIATAAYDVGGTPCEVEFTVPRVLPEVSGDPAALRRVFQNLIANAVKHAGDGGWIGIKVSASARPNGGAPPAIEVQVADRGPGIPQKEQSEIFKPFTRGAAAQSRQVRGTGLGLSLAREIVEAHGGTIAVRSEPGCGATFTVRLPAQ